MDANLASR